MKLFVFAIVVVFTASQVSSFRLSKNKDLADECGILNKNLTTHGFIVGGEETEPHTYPWIGALHWGGRWACGSALISDEWVLTAAHCIETSEQINIYLGSHDITASDEPNRLVVKAEKAIAHEGYNFPHNDIAVIKLTEKVEFNDYIRPICLPNKREQEEPFFGADVIGIGWGEADNGNGMAGLRQVELNTLKESETQQYCDDEYPSVLCVNTQGGSVGVCFGDSGSPLNYVRDNGQVITLGAASFVINGCYDPNPSGYSRVTNNLDWISEKTGIPIED